MALRQKLAIATVPELEAKEVSYEYIGNAERQNACPCVCVHVSSKPNESTAGLKAFS